VKHRGLAAFLLLALAWPAAAGDPRAIELENGERVAYLLSTFPEDSHRLESGKDVAPTSALNTAKLVTRYLSEGRIEDASLLSNAPKARYERLRESFEGWSAADFERAYGRYFAPGNRIVGEAAIGEHRLIMWYLKDTDYLTGYFLVEIEGKLLLDDVPSKQRASLRRVLEAYRSGKAQ